MIPDHRASSYVRASIFGRCKFLEKGAPLGRGQLFGPGREADPGRRKNCGEPAFVAAGGRKIVDELFAALGKSRSQKSPPQRGSGEVEVFCKSD